MSDSVKAYVATLVDYDGEHEVAITRDDFEDIKRQLRYRPTVVMIKGVAVEFRYALDVARDVYNYFGGNGG